MSWDYDIVLVTLPYLLLSVEISLSELCNRIHGLGSPLREIRPGDLFQYATTSVVMLHFFRGPYSFSARDILPREEWIWFGLGTLSLDNKASKCRSLKLRIRQASLSLLE